MHFVATVIQSLLCILLMFQYQPHERKKKKMFDEDGNEIIEPVDPEKEAELAEQKALNALRSIQMSSMLYILMLVFQVAYLMYLRYSNEEKIRFFLAFFFLTIICTTIWGSYIDNNFLIASQLLRTFTITAA